MGKISRGGGDYTCKRGSTQNSGREQLYADAMKGESGGRTEEQECQTILRTQEVWGAQGESLSQSCRLKESAPFQPDSVTGWVNWVLITNPVVELQALQLGLSIKSAPWGRRLE